MRGQLAVPGKPRCTVKPSTTSAWVEVMLDPPGVDWRIVNYVHDGYITLSRYECNVARSKPRSFSRAGALSFFIISHDFHIYSSYHTFVLSC